MKIKVSKYIYDKCVEFAHQRIDASRDLYSYRGEHKEEKMIEDCIIGTVGEWGAYNYLKSHGIIVKKPDMNLYESKRKSFSADLYNDDFDFHVKSQGQQSIKRYGKSWLLQRYDRVVKKPEDYEYFIFTSVNGREVDILGTVLCADITNNDLYGECRVPRFRKTKVALYLDDLCSIDLRRF